MSRLARLTRTIKPKLQPDPVTLQLTPGFLSFIYSLSFHLCSCVCYIHFKILTKFWNFFYLLYTCFDFFSHFYFLCFMVVPLFHCLCAYLSFSEIIVLIWMFFFLLLLILYSVLLLLSLFSHLSVCLLLSRRRVKLVVIFLSTFTFILFCRQKDPPLLWCVMCKAPGACLLSLQLSLSFPLYIIHTHTHTHTHSSFLVFSNVCFSLKPHENWATAAAAIHVWHIGTQPEGL